jgi:hypothetical protein
MPPAFRNSRTRYAKSGVGLANDRRTGDYVAIILAVGISLALNIVTIALLYAAMVRMTAGAGIGLSENGVQLLTGWGGGLLSILGAYIGFQFGRAKPNGEPSPPGEPPPP